MVDQPHVIGSWVTDDTSANHLEIAQTDAQNGNDAVMALRDTNDPGHIIYATQGQLRLFVNAAQKQDSRTARLIGAGR